MKSITLNTERLLLRPFELSDVDDVFEYAQDPEWGRYLPVPEPYEREHAVAFVNESVQSSWATNPVFALSRNGRVVGAINLAIDAVNRSAEIGYSLARAHWGHGLVGEAVQVVLEWVFVEFDVTKVIAEVDAANTRSIRVLEKLGMNREASSEPEHTNAREPSTQSGEIRYVVLRERS